MEKDSEEKKRDHSRDLIKGWKEICGVKVSRLDHLTINDKREESIYHLHQRFHKSFR